MGEIGRDRHEFLYEMMWWEITLIIQGYRRRNVLQYQLQRITAWASAYCMGNKNNVKPEDFFHLYCDDYLEQGETEAQLTEDEIKQMQEEMNAWNFSLEQNKEGSK